jgi:hypothetical protein
MTVTCFFHPIEVAFDSPENPADINECMSSRKESRRLSDKRSHKSEK